MKGKGKTYRGAGNKAKLPSKKVTPVKQGDKLVKGAASIKKAAKKGGY